MPRDRLFKHVKSELEQSIATKRWVLENLPTQIAQAVEMVVQTLQRGGKVLLCGNGGIAADAQHIAGEFVGRFAFDRRPLPAIALTTDTSVLTAIGNDYSYDQIFSRQVEALAHPADFLIGISTSGRSPNVLGAVEAASQIGAKTIGLLGRDGGTIQPKVDLAIVVHGKEAWHIQEAHITIGHVICALLERELFKGEA